MAQFDVVELTSTEGLGGLTHDETIRFAAALVAATASSANGRMSEKVVSQARDIEEYLRNG